jgi:hypothetical protein
MNIYMRYKLNVWYLEPLLVNDRYISKFKLYCYRRSVGQCVLVSGPLLGAWPNFNFLSLTISFSLLHVGCTLWWEDRSLICSEITHWLESRRTHNHILLSHLRLPPTWRARSPYIYPPGTGCPSYTLGHWVPFPSQFTTRRAAAEVF